MLRERLPWLARLTRLGERKNKSYRISADVEIPEGGAEGVLATQGGRFSGWGLLVLDGKPVFVVSSNSCP